MKASHLDLSFIANRRTPNYMAMRRVMCISRFHCEAYSMRARVVDRTETQTHTLTLHVSVQAMETAHPGYTKIFARRLCAESIATGQHPEAEAGRVGVRQVVTGAIPEPPPSSFKFHLPPYPATCTHMCFGTPIALPHPHCIHNRRHRPKWQSRTKVRLGPGRQAGSSRREK